MSRFGGDAFDDDARLHGHLRLVDDRLPKLDELLFAHRAALHGADRRELERAGHDDLRARVVHDRSADLAALEEDDAATFFHQSKRRAHSRRAGADDDRVVRVARAAPPARRDVVRGLASLAHRVSDQAHAPELADDVDAGARRLEMRIDERQLHAALGRAEDELDRVDGARVDARRVTDARERVQELRLTADHAEHLLLGAREHARAGADAAMKIDHGMDRVGDDLAERGHVLERRQRSDLLLSLAAAEHPIEDRGEHDASRRSRRATHARG